jgi:hypothetical protein
MSKHNPLGTKRCDLELMSKLAKPHVQPRPVRLGELRNINVTPGLGKLVSEPALPVRRRGPRVPVKEQDIRHRAILASAGSTCA